MAVTQNAIIPAGAALSNAINLGDRALTAIQMPVAGTTATVTFSAPGILQVSWTAHALKAGMPVVFTNSGGALPTGLLPNIPYYVLSVIDANTFTVSATKGGQPINTTVAGTGTQTGTSGGWTTAGLTFQGTADGINFFNVLDDTGTEYVVTTPDVGKIMIVRNPDLFIPVKQLIVRSGTSASPVNQVGTRLLLCVSNIRWSD